jgi:Putative beta barrel porin-7 (BBP7)
MKFSSIGVLLLAAGLGMAQPPSAPPPDQAPTPRPFPAGPTGPDAAPGTARPPDGGVLYAPVPPAGPGCCAHGCRDYVDCDGASEGQYWLDAEYLLMWIKASPTPPLVTAGTARSEGILGHRGTTTLFGGDDLRFPSQSGGRFGGGLWLDDGHCLGLEANGFFLTETSRNAAFPAGCAPVLARPFCEANNGEQSVELASFPGISSGGVRVHEDTELAGAQVNLFKHCGCYCLDLGPWNWSGDLRLLGGFRYLNLEENLDVGEQKSIFSIPEMTAAGIGPATIAAFSRIAGSSFVTLDHFGTRNNFYGGQAGIQGELRCDRFFMNASAKLALGDTEEEITITGEQIQTTRTGRLRPFAGGLLALPSNSGRFTRDRFAYVPEFNGNVGYQVSCNVRLYVGYEFLYWSRVVRPGEQVDPNLDVNKIPNSVLRGPALTQPHPVVPFRESDFWASGVNFGVEITF